MATRRRDSLYSAGPKSRIAATGGTRDARMAGMTEATNVVSVPTANAAMMVRGSSWVEVEGREIPKALSSPCSPIEITNPKASPMAEAKRPTTSASPRTERRTCLAEAPIARSMASSRVRWAIRIENVLKMMKAPTNSEMPANTSRAMLKNDRPCLIWSEASWAASAPVLASKPDGRTAWIRLRRTLGEVPRSAATSMVSHFPPPFSATCASWGSKATMVAPARLSDPPIPKMPAIS